MCSKPECIEKRKREAAANKKAMASKKSSSVDFMKKYFNKK